MLVKFDLKNVLANSGTTRQFIDNIPKMPGDSFLLNYTDLKNQYRFYKKEDVKNYIVLAAYRDYGYARTYDDYTLDWDMTSFTIEQINVNKLIWHSNKRIFFLFEESKASTLRMRNKNGN